MTTEQAVDAEIQLSESVDAALEILEPEYPHKMEGLAGILGDVVYTSIQNASNGTERSEQQRDHMIGLSTLGHCRQYAALMMKQTPFSDVRDKTPAFIGTVLGEAIENQMKIDHPDWLFQGDVLFSIPSGGKIKGHFDFIVPADAATEEIPQMVGDLKSKAELETIQKYGQSQQQIFQLTGYTSAAIDAGLLDPSKPIKMANIYYDRSGKERHPYVIVLDYDPSVLTLMDQWIEDVKYAVIHGEDASRDQSREWCMSWCEYATVCRTWDTDVEGLLTDPEVVSAVDVYLEGSAMLKEGKNKQDAAKRVLLGQSGSTGKHLVKTVHVNAVEMKASTRSAYQKLSISAIKPKPAPRTRKKPANVVQSEGNPQ